MARDQLLAAGINDDAIARRVKRGHLHPRHRHVYAAGHLAPAPLVAETAALLACGDGAVLSHLSAALLWKLVPAAAGDSTVHVTVPGRHGPRLEGVQVHRTTTLTAFEVRIQERLPLTWVARTLLDLAEFLPTRELEDAVDEALAQRLVSKRMLAATAAGASGRRGGPRLKSALARHTVTQELRSKGEKRLRDLIRAAELPEPRTNVYVHGCLVDAYWPEHGLVVEFDSVKFHSSRPVFEKDRSKGNKLVAAGLALMRLTWRQLDEQPFVVVARIAQALVRGEGRHAA